MKYLYTIKLYTEYMFIQTITQEIVFSITKKNTIDRTQSAI